MWVGAEVKEFCRREVGAFLVTLHDQFVGRFANHDFTPRTGLLKEDISFSERAVSCKQGQQVV